MDRYIAVFLCAVVFSGCAAQKDIIKDNKAVLAAASAIELAKQDAAAAREAGAEKSAKDLLASAEEKIAVAEDAFTKADYQVATVFAGKADADALKAKDRALATKALNDAGDDVRRAKEGGAEKETNGFVASAEELLGKARAAFALEDYKKAAEFASLASEKAREALRLLELSGKVLALIKEAETAIADALKEGAGKKAPELLGSAQGNYDAAVKSNGSGDYVNAISLASKALDDAKAALSACAAVRTPEYIVRKGDCLWRISAKKEVDDDPFLWPMILKANSDKISDPDLIYPQQDFILPALAGEGAKDSARKDALKHISEKKKGK